MNEMDAEFIAERDVRSEPRLADSKKGVLSNKEVWSPCLIQNISSNGFIISNNHVVFEENEQKPFETFEICITFNVKKMCKN